MKLEGSFVLIIISVGYPKHRILLYESVQCLDIVIREALEFLSLINQDLEIRSLLFSRARIDVVENRLKAYEIVVYVFDFAGRPTPAEIRNFNPSAVRFPDFFACAQFDLFCLDPSRPIRDGKR